jgi:hypothetical protein
VVGVACYKRPTRKMGQKLRVTNGGYALTPHRVTLIPNGEQSDGGVTEDRQVVLTELREGLVDSLSRVSSRSSPRAVVNQAIMVGSVG